MKARRYHTQKQRKGNESAWRAAKASHALEGHSNSVSGVAITPDRRRPKWKTLTATCRQRRSHDRILTYLADVRGGAVGGHGCLIARLTSSNHRLSCFSLATAIAPCSAA